MHDRVKWLSATVRWSSGCVPLRPRDWQPLSGQLVRVAIGKKSNKKKCSCAKPCAKKAPLRKVAGSFRRLGHAGLGDGRGDARLRLAGPAVAGSQRGFVAVDVVVHFRYAVWQRGAWGGWVGGREGGLGWVGGRAGRRAAGWVGGWVVRSLWLKEA